MAIRQDVEKQLSCKTRGFGVRSARQKSGKSPTYDIGVRSGCLRGQSQSRETLCAQEYLHACRGGSMLEEPASTDMGLNVRVVVDCG